MEQELGFASQMQLVLWQFSMNKSCALLLFGNVQATVNDVHFFPGERKQRQRQKGRKRRRKSRRREGKKTCIANHLVQTQNVPSGRELLHRYSDYSVSSAQCPQFLHDHACHSRTGLASCLFSSFSGLIAAQLLHFFSPFSFGGLAILLRSPSLPSALLSPPVQLFTTGS